MKVKDMFTKEFHEKYGDIDVYDWDYDTEGIAFCGALLTHEGKNHYHEVLELEVIEGQGFYGAMPIMCIKSGNYRLCKLAEELFWDCAGYCDEEDYDKWFEFWEEE